MLQGYVRHLIPFAPEGSLGPSGLFHRASFLSKFICSDSSSRMSLGSLFSRTPYSSQCGGQRGQR